MLLNGQETPPQNLRWKLFSGIRTFGERDFVVGSNKTYTRSIGSVKKKMREKPLETTWKYNAYVVGNRNVKLGVGAVY
jgi:hypothetical protein